MQLQCFFSDVREEAFDFLFQIGFGVILNQRKTAIFFLVDLSPSSSSTAIFRRFSICTAILARRLPAGRSSWRRIIITASPTQPPFDSVRVRAF